MLLSNINYATTTTTTSIMQPDGFMLHLRAKEILDAVVVVVVAFQSIDRKVTRRIFQRKK
jgi:hypothetical protein